MGSLLYNNHIEITDDIKVIIPTVGEVLENAESYYGLLTSIISMPIDLMVQLDDMGIDFETIDAYQLFLIMFKGFQNLDISETALIFGDLDLSRFKYAYNDNTNDEVLIDTERDIVIDRLVHDRIAISLRLIHNIKKNIQKPGNAEAKAYMLERARKKQKRNRSNKEKLTLLESQIISLVNKEEFKYNYEETKNLSIYQFNQSLKQILHTTDYNNRMIGIYTGNIDAKKLSPKDLVWMYNE